MVGRVLIEGDNQGGAVGVLNDFAVQGSAQAAVEDDADRLAQGGEVAYVEQRIVGQYGADAGEHGATFGAQFLYVGTRFGAGNPFAAAV